MDGTILVADDDRTIRTVLTQALTRAGCKVHATSSLVTLMLASTSLSCSSIPSLCSLTLS